jgi:hypothetical protein
MSGSTERRRRAIGDGDRVPHDQAPADRKREHAVGEVQVVVDALDGETGAALRTDVGGDVVRGELGDLGAAEERAEMAAEDDPVVLNRGGLALHHLVEVPEIASADLLECEPLSARRHVRLRHQLAQASLGLRPRQPGSRAGLAARPQLPLHLTTGDPPLPIEGPRPNEDRSRPIRPLPIRSHQANRDHRRNLAPSRRPHPTTDRRQASAHSCTLRVRLGPQSDRD